MKITFNIEADTAAEFAEALAVITNRASINAPCPSLHREQLERKEQILSRELLDKLGRPNTTSLTSQDLQIDLERVSREPMRDNFRTDVNKSSIGTGGVVEGNNLAIIGDNPNRQEVVTEEEIRNLTSNEPEKKTRTRRTKAQIEEELKASPVTLTQAERDAALAEGDAMGFVNPATGEAIPEQPAVLPTTKPVTLDEIRELVFPINKSKGPATVAVKKWLADGNYAGLNQIPEERLQELADFMREQARLHKVDLTVTP